MDPVEHRQIRHFQNQIHAAHLALADIRVNRALAVASTLSLQARVETAKSPVSAERLKAQQLCLAQARVATTAESAQLSAAQYGLESERSQLAPRCEAWALRLQTAQQAIEAQRRAVSDRRAIRQPTTTASP